MKTKEVFHNTKPTKFKDFLIIKSINKRFVVSRKRYDYKINDIIIKLPKKITIIEYLKSLDIIATINLTNIEECKDKKLLVQLQPNSKKIYDSLGFNYSTFSLFKESVQVLPL